MTETLPQSLDQPPYNGEAFKGRELAAGLPAGLGHAAMLAETASSVPRTALPEGYIYLDNNHVSPAEVADLLRVLPGAESVTAEYLSERQEIVAETGRQVFDVAIADESGKLAGFGSLVYGDGEGLLCDFAVSPEHQGRGVGKAIVSERLSYAHEHDIELLQIPYLEDTNTLKSYYLEYGFDELDDGSLMWQR